MCLLWKGSSNKWIVNYMSEYLRNTIQVKVNWCVSFFLSDFVLIILLLSERHNSRRVRPNRNKLSIPVTINKIVRNSTLIVCLKPAKFRIYLGVS